MGKGRELRTRNPPVGGAPSPHVVHESSSGRLVSQRDWCPDHSQVTLPSGDSTIGEMTLFFLRKDPEEF